LRGAKAPPLWLCQTGIAFRCEEKIGSAGFDAPFVLCTIMVLTPPPAQSLQTLGNQTRPRTLRDDL